MWDVDWTDVRGAIIGTLGASLVIGVVLWVREARRKISFSATQAYFGPALTANAFMGRNHPSEDLIGLDCHLNFFSNKSVATGLHNFQLEFCRQTYMGAVVEFAPDMRYVLRDRDSLEKGKAHSLKTLDLPSRQFVPMQLSTSIDREHWPALRPCTLIRLSCETPEGKKKHFAIKAISFPQMPAEGLRGVRYCCVQLGPNAPMHKDSRVIDDSRVIVAIRHQKPPLMGQLPAEEDIRYWTGHGWTRPFAEAKVFPNQNAAREEGEPIKIWNNVPAEWVNDERRYSF